MGECLIIEDSMYTLEQQAAFQRLALYKLGAGVGTD